MNSAELVRIYDRLGLHLVPIPARLKSPIARGWQLPENRLTFAEIEEHVAKGGNLGFRCGPTSADIIDVDLDCIEALALADIFLPPTGAMFGRAAKPSSHRLYRSPGVICIKFSDPITGKMLVELRGDGRTGGGHQTLLPPSVADGERREWEGDRIEPAVYEARLLTVSCIWLAIACLTWRYIPEYRARQPEFDLLDLLWQADPEHKLGHAAYRWVGWPAPDEKPARSARSTRSAKATSPVVARGRLPSVAALAEFVSRIDNDCGWEQWNTIGMAIYAASAGALYGFKVFDDFSSRHPLYKPAAVLERWSNYGRSPPTQLSFGTLVWLAEHKGRAA